MDCAAVQEPESTFHLQKVAKLHGARSFELALRLSQASYPINVSSSTSLRSVFTLSYVFDACDTGMHARAIRGLQQSAGTCSTTPIAAALPRHTMCTKATEFRELCSQVDHDARRDLAEEMSLTAFKTLSTIDRIYSPLLCHSLPPLEIVIFEEPIPHGLELPTMHDGLGCNAEARWSMHPK